MKKLPKISFGTILLVFAALANLARWTGMFTIVDDMPSWAASVITALGAFSGLVSGLSVAGGLAFIAHRLGALQPFTPKRKPIMRFWGSLTMGMSIIAMSAFLLPPYVRMMTPERLRIEIENINAWSIMSVLVGDLIIVAVALSDGKSAGFTQSAAPAKSAKPQSAALSKSPTKSARSASKYPRKCAHCDALIQSPNAVGGHMKKNHPKMCKGALADNLFQNANQ